MLAIVFYHASGLAAPGPLRDFGAALMGPALKAFFLISGYLSLTTFRHRGPRSYLQTRFLSLALPLITMLILIIPIQHYLRYGFQEAVPYGTYSLTTAIQGSISGEWDGYELHLWFLIVLLAYVLLLPVCVPVLAWLGRRLNDMRPATLTYTFVFLVAIWSVLCWRLFGMVDLHRLASPFLGYLPFFLAGAIAAASANVHDALHKASVPLLLLAATALAAAILYRGPGWGYVERFGESLFSTIVVICMLNLSRRFFNGSTKISRMLSRTIYTVYLLHPLVMFTMLCVLGVHIGQVTAPLVIALFVIATLIPMAVHLLLIERFPILELLFNGRLPSRTGSISAAK